MRNMRILQEYFLWRPFGALKKGLAFSGGSSPSGPSPPVMESATLRVVSPSGREPFGLLSPPVIGSTARQVENKVLSLVMTNAQNKRLLYKHILLHTAH